jgi:hypothetical protein
MKRRHFLGIVSALGAAAALPAPLIAAPPAVAPSLGAEGRLPKGMVTFSFDDGIISSYQNGLPILKSRGQLATAGIVASRVTSGNEDYMTVDHVRELAKNGWEIASHSLTHTRPIQIPKTYDQEPISGFCVDEKGHDHFHAQYDYDLIAGLYQDDKPMSEVENVQQLIDTPGTYWYDRPIGELHVHPFRGGDPEALNIRAGSYQRELEESKRILIGLGFDVDSYIAPYNYWTDDVEAMSKRYYARACTGRDSDNRPASFDPYAIKRFMVHSKDSAQSLIRIIKDHAVEYGSWVVFCIHGVGDSMGWEPYPSESLDAVSAWVAEQKIPVVTVRQGTAIMLESRKKPAPQAKAVEREGI